MNHRFKRGSVAFSLVEVTLSIGIIAFGLIAIVGLIPVGMSAAKDAVNDTKATFMAEDIYVRIKGKISRSLAVVANDPAAFDTYINNTLPTPTASVPIPSNVLTIAYLYDVDGKFLYEYSAGTTVPANVTAFLKSNYYRAQVDVCKLSDYTALGYVDNGVLLGVTVQINWPTYTQQTDGGVINPKQTGKTYSFYLRRP